MAGRLQSGTPKRKRVDEPARAHGLLLRGVVVVTYVTDDANHPITTAGLQPTSVYCDVLCYSDLPRFRYRMFRKCLVLQGGRGGMHSGRIWKPRAASMNVTGDAMELGLVVNPANLDGDHVLIGFMDDNYGQPVVLAGLPHPKRDVGNDSKTTGHRMKLKVADGNPDFWKHNGSFYGIDKDGNFVADLTEAHAGALTSTGAEPAAPTDGSKGNYKIMLPQGAKLTVQIAGGANLELDLKDGDAKLKVGTGAKSVALADYLETLYTDAAAGIKKAFDNHAHTTAMGPSGPPGPPGLPTMPAWDAKIKSTKVKIPDE